MLNSEEISVDKIKSGIGGYKKKATKEFVDAVRNDYEAICKENLELKEKLAILSEGVQYYKNMEKSLQKALVLAERTTSETMHAAEVKAVAMEKEAKARADVMKKEAKIEAEAYEKEAAAKAEKMIREAKEQANTAIAEGNEELRKIHSQIMSLIQQYEQYKSQYKQLAMAQMNVLESEAYKLDAPILKTLQYAVEQGENREAKQNSQEHMRQDEVVQPVSVAEELVQEENKQKKSKKVYVDARGEVVEVHEFREVTIPHDGIDPFKDDENEAEEVDFSQFEQDKGVERFDDDDDIDIPVSTSNNENVFGKNEMTENIVEISKSQIEQGRDEQFFGDAQREEHDKFVSSMDKTGNDSEHDTTFDAADRINTYSMTNDYEEKEAEKKSFAELDRKEKDFFPTISEEHSKMSAEAMREIERMQLERLRQEEEEHTKALQQAQDPKSYFTMGSSVNVVDEQKKQENDFYQNVTFGNEKPEMSLRDIKMQEEEQNKHVPLPKASEENLYFSSTVNDVNVSVGGEVDLGQESFFATTSELEKQMERFTEVDRKEMAMQASDIAEEVLQQKKEEGNTFFNQVMNSKNEVGSFFEQFSNQTGEDVKEVQTEESKNSLDFELDFNNGMPTTRNKESGFKSFRDFESEL